MSLRDRLVEGGKKLASSGVVVRLVSNDTVMRVATGVMDARSRLEAVRGPIAEAFSILLNGHALPTIDPALEGETEATGARRNGATARSFVEETPAVNGKATVTSAGSASGSASASAGTSVASANGAAVAVTSSAAEQKLVSQMASRTSLSRIGGRDVFEKCFKFMTADNARAMGVYPFFRPLDFNNGPEAQLEGRTVVMLGSNNYLGLTTHPRVRHCERVRLTTLLAGRDNFSEVGVDVGESKRHTFGMANRHA